MTFKVREATAADIPTLLIFEQGVIAAERPFDETLKDDPVNYYDLPYMIQEDHIHLIVAETDGEIIGCGYARIEEARHFARHSRHSYLGFMFVRQEYRGKGINNLIIEELQRWSASRGITELTLEVYYNNLPAIRAYEKMGFARHMIQMRKGLFVSHT